MKYLRLSGVLLAVVALAGVAPHSDAGGERWIMVMTPERMAREELIHVRFQGPDGTALESDALKKMFVRERGCGSDHTLRMVEDYRMGFSPGDRLVGIYLFPRAWKGKSLCFDIPDIGKAEKSLRGEDGGQSVLLKMMP